MSDYYRSHSRTSNPGAYAHLFDGLPTDLDGISKITQGLVYHFSGDERIFGWKPPQERIPEVNTRTVERMVAALLEKDSRPLTEGRAYEDRILGCCRDFALLACAILRHQGKPARVRHGFASYFDAGYWGDHVVVETWVGDRWLRFDPEIPSTGDWDFNTLDMPYDRFATGGRAWEMCRQENANPANFGLGPGAEGDMQGLGYIIGVLRQDMAALNKVELLCWDIWEGPSEEREEDMVILDEMARLSLNPDSTDLRQKCTADAVWRTPGEVTCLNPAGEPFMMEVA